MIIRKYKGIANMNIGGFLLIMLLIEIINAIVPIRIRRIILTNSIGVTDFQNFSKAII
jgi:hypothetical protein